MHPLVKVVFLNDFPSERECYGRNLYVNQPTKELQWGLVEPQIITAVRSF